MKRDKGREINQFGVFFVMCNFSLFKRQVDPCVNEELILTKEFLI